MREHVMGCEKYTPTWLGATSRWMSRTFHSLAVNAKRLSRIALALALAVAATSQAQEERPARKLELIERIGQPLPPDLVLRDSNGEIVQLIDASECRVGASIKRFIRPCLRGGPAITEYRAYVSGFLGTAAALAFLSFALWLGIYLRSEALRRRGLRNAHWVSGVQTVDPAERTRDSGAETHEDRTFRPT